MEKHHGARVGIFGGQVVGDEVHPVGGWEGHHRLVDTALNLFGVCELGGWAPTKEDDQKKGSHQGTVIANV